MEQSKQQTPSNQSIPSNFDSILSTLFTRTNEQLQHITSHTRFSSKITQILQSDSDHQQTEAFFSIFQTHLANATSKASLAFQLLSIPAQNLVRVIQSLLFNLPNNKSSSVYKNIDLELWTRCILQIESFIFTNFIKKRVVVTQSSRFSRIFSRLYSMKKGEQSLDLNQRYEILENIVNNSNVKDYVKVLILSSYAKSSGGKFNSQVVKRFKEVSAQVYNEVILKGDSNRLHACQLNNYFLYFWDLFKPDQLIENFFNNMKRCFRRNKLLLPLLASIAEEISQESLEQVAEFIVCEILGQAYLVDGQILSEVNEVLQAISGSLFRGGSQKCDEEDKNQQRGRVIGKKIGEYLHEVIKGQSDSQEKKLFVVLNSFALFSSKSLDIKHFEDFLNSLFDVLFDTLNLLTGDIRKQSVSILVPSLTSLFNLFQKSNQATKCLNNFKISSNYYKKMIKSKLYPSEFYMIAQILKSQISPSFKQQFSKQVQNSGLLSTSKVPTGGQSQSQTLLQLYCLVKYSGKDKLSQFLKNNPGISSNLIAKQSAFSQTNFLSGANDNQIEASMYFQILLKYAELNNNLENQNFRVYLNLLTMYFRGKGQFLIRTITPLLFESTQGKIGQNLVKYMLQTMDHLIYEHGSSCKTNDKILQLVYTILQSAKISSNKTLVFQLIELIHHESINYHNEKLQSFIKKLSQKGVRKFSNKEQTPFYSLIKQFLLDAKQDIEQSPLTSKYLPIFPRVGYSIQHLGLYDIQLHRILTSILQNSGRMFEPLRELRNSFKNQLDCLSQHEVNYLASVVRDMGSMMSMSMEEETKNNASVQVKVEEEEEEQKVQNNDTKQQQPQQSEQGTISIDDLLKASAGKKKGNKKSKGKTGAAAKGKKKPPPKPSTTTPTLSTTQSTDSTKTPSLTSSSSTSKQQKYQINISQILKFLELLQNKLQQSTKYVLSTFQFVHKSSSILNLILQNSLQQLVLLLKTDELQYKSKNLINYIFNVHPNSFTHEFNSHLPLILSSFAKNYYNKDETEDIEFIVKQLGMKSRKVKRQLGEYIFIFRLAGYVLGSNEAMLGIKIKALHAVNNLLPDVSDVMKSQKKYQFLEYLSDMTHSMMLSNFNAHSQLQTYLREFVLLLSKNYNKLLYNLIISLFEFDPLCRVTLVKVLASLPPQNPANPQPKQIINLNMIANRTLLVRIWLLLFDDNLQMRRNARKIWNNHHFVLVNLLINHKKDDENLLFYLKHSDSMIQDMCSKSIISLVNIFSQELDLIVKALLDFYIEQIELLGRVRAQQIAFDTPLHLCNADQYKLVKDTPVSQRKIVTRILSECIELLSISTMHNLIDFVIEVGSIDQDEEIRERFVDIGVKIIDMRGNQFSQELLGQLNSKIQSDDQKLSKMRKESQNTAVILCANLAGFVSSETKGLKQLFMRVLELSKSSTLQQLRAIAKALPHLALHFPKLATTTIDKLLTELFQDNQKYATVQSSSYAIAGLMKGLGSIRMIEQRKLIEQCRGYFTKQKQKQNGQQRLATFILYRAFADVLGKSFEIFLKEVMPDILGSYSDSKDFVKNQVAKLMKSLVMTLSGFAVKVLIPQFLQGIKEDSWRTKLASAQALGSMAFCAPKQLSLFLPRIVNELKDILTDAQPKVAESGIKALGSIGSVAQNPEVAEISNSLINALKDPEHGLKISLDVLLKTNFSHLIDAPSLSLLIPVLYNGLFSHLPQNNINAAIVVAHICQLIQVPQDLIPYLDIIMPALRSTLFSADPAVRATAASAVGSLSKGLGLKNSNDLLIWLKSILKSTTGSSTQKSGAAHGLSQVITAHGQSLFEKMLPQLMEQSRDANGGVRQAFRGVFAFLPKSYGQEFQKYFGYLLPLVMEGLSDTFQGVRSISTRTMRVLVEQYGSNHSETFLGLLRQKALAPDWRMRQNALVLLTQFIQSIKQDMHRQDPINITEKERNDILALLFMMKFDPNQKVNAICSFQWKHLVHNQPLVIKSVFKNLMELCCQRITDPKSAELQIVAAQCFSGIVGKFRDRFIRDTLEYFKKNLLFMGDDENDRIDARQLIIVPQGYKNYDNVAIICQALKNMFNEADVGLLTPYRHQIVNLIFPLFLSDIKHLRIDAANVLAILLCKIQEQEEQYLTFVFRLIIQQMEMQSPSISCKLPKQFYEDSKEQSKQRKKQIYLNQTQQHLAPGYKLLECLQHLSTFYQNIQYRKMILPIIYDTFQRYDVHSNTIGIFKQNLRPWHLRSLSTLANHIGTQTFRRKRHTLVIRFLLTTLDDRNLPFDLCDGCVYALKKLIVQVPTEDLTTLWALLNDFIMASDLDQENKVHRDRYNYYFCTVLTYYFQNHTESYSPISESAFQRLISLVNNNDASEEVNNAITLSIHSLLSGLSQQVHQIFIPILADQLRSNPKSTSKLFATSQGLDTFITLTLNSVSRGTTDLRREAALAMRYILIKSHDKLSRSLIMKISGQLIRVVMDRFGDELKHQIYIAFDIIISNLNVAILAPQLQSTFTRAIVQQSSSDLSIFVGELLIKTLKQKPRVDQILRDFETTAGKIQNALNLGDQEEQQVIRNNAIILYSITHCQALILRYFSGKEISTDSRKNLLQSFQRRISISLEQGKKYNEIKKIGEISTIALGYLQPHLIQSDVKSVWDNVFGTISFDIKVIGIISFITSGVHNATQLFEQQFISMIKKSDVDLTAIRHGLLLNLSILKKCIGCQRLIQKGPEIFCADEVGKGLMRVIELYIQRVKDCKSATEDIISEVLNGDRELFKLLLIPKGKDGNKLRNIAKSALDGVVSKAKQVQEGQEELQFAKCLAFKIGSINKLQYESIYSFGDLNEVL